MTWWRLISTWCCPGCPQRTVQDLTCLQNSYLGQNRPTPQRVPDLTQSSCESVRKSRLLRWWASAPNPALGSQQHGREHTLLQLQLLPQTTHHLHRRRPGFKHGHTEVKLYCVFIAGLERLDLERIRGRNGVKDELDHDRQVFQLDRRQSEQNAFTDLKRESGLWPVGFH